MNVRSLLMLCIGAWIFLCLPCASSAADETSRRKADEAKSSLRADYRPVLRIPLRIHLGKSAWRPAKFIPVAEEISNIWLTQAGICFETEIVRHDRPAANRFDVWFSPHIAERPGYKGLFKEENDIHVRDLPVLCAAAHPARSSTSRTAAHEMGHALGLSHRQDSNDNLMRSKTYGWQLNDEEIRQARTSAASKALPDPEPLRCSVTVQ